MTINLLDIHIHPLTMSQTIAHITRWVNDGNHLHQICTANPEFVMRAQQDPTFKHILNTADLTLADGIGLVWGARWRGQHLPQRVPGSELVYHIAQACAQHGWSLFLLGAAEGVAPQAAQILQKKYPALKIVGTYAGSPAPAENDHIVQLINNSRAQLLYVAYGAPKQDQWIARNKANLPHVRVAIGVGGSLDFITGRATRAPRWVQNIGLEWLHRLILEPWRWRRMLALPRFAWRILFFSR